MYIDESRINDAQCSFLMQSTVNNDLFSPKLEATIILLIY